MYERVSKIAIAGVGTVGTGVLELLKKKSFYKNSKIVVTAIASRRKINLDTFGLKKITLFKDAKNLINFNDYDVLVELIGGDEGISKEIVFSALEKGKNVVTANKALVSKHWKKLYKLTTKNNNFIKYEAAVAGGIPIIKILDDFLISNQIKRIYGILNGTSNFILTKMYETNQNFKSILKQAQKLGYAESDPSFDVDGTDSAHKLSILSSLSFNIDCDIKTIHVEGIKDINLTDLLYADELGYKIKLLGISEFLKKKLINFVYPCLVEKAVS